MGSLRFALCALGVVSVLASGAGLSGAQVAEEAKPAPAGEPQAADAQLAVNFVVAPRYWIAGTPSSTVVEVHNQGDEVVDDLFIRVESQPAGRILRHGAVERRLSHYFKEGLTELACEPEKQELACRVGSLPPGVRVQLLADLDLESEVEQELALVAHASLGQEPEPRASGQSEFYAFLEDPLEIELLAPAIAAVYAGDPNQYTSTTLKVSHRGKASSVPLEVALSIRHLVEVTSEGGPRARRLSDALSISAPAALVPQYAPNERLQCALSTKSEDVYECSIGKLRQGESWNNDIVASLKGMPPGTRGRFVLDVKAHSLPTRATHEVPVISVLPELRFATLGGVGGALLRPARLLDPEARFRVAARWLSAEASSAAERIWAENNADTKLQPAGEPLELALLLVVGGEESVFKLRPFEPAASLFTRRKGEIVLATEPVRVIDLPGYEADRTRGLRAMFRLGAGDASESSTTVGIGGSGR